MEEQQNQATAEVSVDNDASQLYDAIKSAIENPSEITVATFVLLVPKAMELVEAIPNLSGTEKKKLVIDVLARLVADLPIQDEVKATILSFIENQLPTVIDIVVNSSIGEYAINVVEEVEQGAKNCFAKCFPRNTSTEKQRVLRKSRQPVKK